LFDTKTFTGAYARILFSSRANIPVSMNPLIYVNESIDLCQRDTAVPESSARFPRSAGSFVPKDCFPLGRGTGARRALAALELVNHAHQGCMGSFEPGCPHAGHDPYAVRRQSRMCSHKPVERFDLRRRRPPSAHDQGTNSPDKAAKTG